MSELRVIAMDLDGTLTEHRTPLGQENRAVLNRLRVRYRLLMVGAGVCTRIFRQLGEFPIDIIGSYGMQYAEFDSEARKLHICYTETAPIDREGISRKARALRERFSLTEFDGDGVEFHETGAFTFPVLGTLAPIEKKLAYDPDCAKRKAMYPAVKEAFPDYHVMIGGSSSFDAVPAQYGKANALRRYMKEQGLSAAQILYFGDGWQEGGNDHDVYESGIPFIRVDSYRNFGVLVQKAGLLP